MPWVRIHLAISDKLSLCDDHSITISSSFKAKTLMSDVIVFRGNSEIARKLHPIHKWNLHGTKMAMFECILLLSRCITFFRCEILKLR